MTIDGNHVIKLFWGGSLFTDKIKRAISIPKAVLVIYIYKFRSDVICDGVIIFDVDSVE